jgi:multiple sugar transport system substrate-binding protein
LISACTPPAPAPQAAPAESAPAEAAPAQQAAGSDADVLRVWITWGDNPAQLQALFDRYGAEKGVRVEVNAPVDDDKVIAGLSGSEPPHVLVTGGPDNTGTWGREGLIIPLDDFLDGGAVDLDDIYDAPLGQCLYGDTHYCLPWGTDAYALFWNKDLFEDAGLDPESPPQTMEELAEMAKQLTKVDANGQITQIGFVPNFSWSHLDLYVAMFGGYWYNEEGTQLTLTSEPMVNALKWQQQFYCDYDTDEVARLTSSFGGYASPDNGFYSGKIAMQVEGEWQHGPNFIQAYKPELYYGVAPFPAPEAHPENAGTVILSGSVAMIPANVQDKEAAFDLLTWMVSPEILAEQMVANYNLPTSGKAAEDPRFHENDKFVVHLELANGENARSPILSPINAEVLTALEQIEEQVLYQCADPLPLLEEAQARLQPELDNALSE